MYKESRVLQGLPAIQDLRETPVLLDQRVRSDPRVFPEPMAIEDFRVYLVIPVPKANKESLVSRVQKVIQAFRDLRATSAQKDRLAQIRRSQARPDRKAPLDRKAKRVHLVRTLLFRDRQDPPDPKEK